MQKDSELEVTNNSPSETPHQVPDRGLIMAKSTAIAMFIVLLTLGAIFIILTLIK